MAQPRSIKQICRDLEIGLGGQTRRTMAQLLDDALFSMWEKAVEVHGPEHAAALMWYVIQRDPSFACPHWLKLCLKRHKAYIIDSFGAARQDPTG